MREVRAREGHRHGTQRLRDLQTSSELATAPELLAVKSLKVFKQIQLTIQTLAIVTQNE
jgi:hypothetical protein